MTKKSPPYYIVTGPPGSGKTSLIDQLRQDVNVVNEPARRVLAAQRRIGGEATGDQNPALCIEEMLTLSAQDYDGAQGRTVFDRGLPDLLAFAAYYNVLDAPIRAAIKTRPYRQTVFYLPSWELIYEQDDERRLDFAGAAAFGTLITAAYEALGYTLVTVPKSTLVARASFVRAYFTD